MEQIERETEQGMEAEYTLGDIYDEIAERLALARTKALIGERQEALGLMQGASLEFTRFRDVLADYPGYLALEHAFTVTMSALRAEQHEPELRAEQPAKTRKRARRAA